MIQWLRKDAWRSLRSYSLWLFLRAFGIHNFSFVYWKHIATSASMTPFLPLGHKRSLTWLSSSSLGNWGRDRCQTTCYNYIGKLQHCNTSAMKTEFHEFQTGVSIPSQPPLIFCFYFLAQWPKLNKQEVISNHMSWHFDFHAGRQAKTTIGGDSASMEYNYDIPKLLNRLLLCIQT